MINLFRSSPLATSHGRCRQLSRRHALPVCRQGYRRREPENALLYCIVSAKLDALRAELVEASPYGSGLPKHVDKESEAYLRCGILAHGFARVVCRACHAEHLVGFSC